MTLGNMTLDEAIEQLGIMLDYYEKLIKKDKDAVQLGIEALERLKELRQATGLDFDDALTKLPSETEKRGGITCRDE